jgi:hypothetical protein
MAIIECGEAEGFQEFRELDHGIQVISEGHGGEGSKAERPFNGRLPSGGDGSNDGGRDKADRGVSGARGLGINEEWGEGKVPRGAEDDGEGKGCRSRIQ